MKVIVLGSGVIGTTTAYFLARNGHEVTVIDKEPDAGMSCSHANGGQLSYSHIQTWASQISPMSVLKNLIRYKSPILIQDFNKESLKWMMEFYQNSFEYKARKSSEKLWQLSLRSKDALAQIVEDEPNLDFSYKKQGNMHFYCNKKLFDNAVKEIKFHNQIGCQAEVLTAQQCVDIEPTLTKILDEKKLVGGIFYSLDASGDCFAFTKGLEEICRRKYGVKFEYEVDIHNIFTNYKKITGINTNKKVYTADAYVYALGAAGSKLLKGIKIDTKIYPMKGYSLSIEADNTRFIAPNFSMTDCENKIVYSRIGNIFRVAGTIEISGSAKKKNQNMIDFLASTTRATFSDFGNTNNVSEWFGFRPFRPNSLPLICQVKKYGNLFLNTGHGALGWTLSAGSGKFLSDLITTGRHDKNLKFLEEEGDSL